MSPNSAPDTAPEVFIDYQDGVWCSTALNVSQKYRTVTFINRAERACEIFFDKVDTFGVSFIFVMARNDETLTIHQRNSPTRLSISDAPTRVMKHTSATEPIIIDP